MVNVQRIARPGDGIDEIRVLTAEAVNHGLLPHEDQVRGGAAVPGDLRLAYGPDGIPRIRIARNVLERGDAGNHRDSGN